MILKSLEIQGFKSFPDKTKIEFGHGLTAVVGPNGSGKSNISDAVRWVMGEQSTKNLRGAKMEDVIFTGTKTRKSQGFAEVSLIIDNSDHTLEIDSDEVVITRKYYRSGDSEYMINRANVRLRDINELFMDTGLGRDGYAMVGQGRIAEIVQSKSDERREIFEEAAGISKYRYRKNEAERKLKSAEENLLRLRDILTELEERVGPLKVQSEKAKRFLELSEEKKILELSVWVHTLTSYNAQIKDRKDKMLARQLEEEALESQISALETSIQEIYDSMQQCLVDIDDLRRKKDETEQEISRINAEIAVCRNDILHNQENQERVSREISGFRSTKEQFEKELREKKQGIAVLEKRLEQVHKTIQEKEAQVRETTEVFDRYLEQSNHFTKLINDLLVKQSHTKLLLSQTETQNTSREERLEVQSDLLVQRQEALEQSKRGLEDTKELLETLAEQEQSLQNSLQGYKMKRDRRQEHYQEIEQKQTQLNLKQKEKLQNAKILEDLERNFEGFAYSVKAVLRQGKNRAIDGILGTVSQVLTVQAEYTTAVEIALGGMLQHIVVESESSAKHAIRFLKQQNAGRATFLPLTAVKGYRLNTGAFENTDGFIALACDLVQYDRRYEGIVLSLLGRIAVVDDLDTAVLIAKKNGYKFKIVTLDGQVINAGGSMSGGSTKGKSQGILSRKSDIAKLRQESEQIGQQMQEVAGELHQAEQELGAVKAQIQAVNSELITISEDKIRCEGEQARLSQQYRQDEEQLASMQAELDALRKRLADSKNKREELRLEMSETEQSLSRYRTEQESLQGKQSRHNQEREQMTEELNTLMLQKTGIQKDIENGNIQIQDLAARGASTLEQEERLKHQLDTYHQDNEHLEEKVQALTAEIEQRHKSSEQMDALVQEKLKKRTELEGKTTTLRKEERELTARKEKAVQELVRYEERILTVQKEYDSIINKMWEEYEMTRSEADAAARPLEDISAAERELISMRGKIRALGSVNVAAIEEYREVLERYEFMNTQLTDVEKSRNELLRMIEELTGKMREIFEENFREINRHFQSIFIDLFGGGQAELRLTEPDDVLLSGIEILVEPPGKIIKNLSLLSGGEQAFVAIAIYFAILKVHPAPFCILDEIEAALDDVNVTRYAEYLRLMSDKTQFIMITHRRGTMEEADVLYGVTMQDEGVSKLLQLNVSEVENKLGNIDAQ